MSRIDYVLFAVAVVFFVLAAIPGQKVGYMCLAFACLTLTFLV